MAHIVVLDAGLGGTIMAYELRDAPVTGSLLSTREQNSASSRPTHGLPWAGTAELFYEKLALQVLGISKLRAVKQDKTGT